MRRELYVAIPYNMGYAFRNKYGKRYNHSTLHIVLKKAVGGKTDLSLKNLERGTAINRLINKYGLLAAMAQVGHKRIATTQKYVGIPNMRSIKPKVVYTRAKKQEKNYSIFNEITTTPPY